MQNLLIKDDTTCFYMAFASIYAGDSNSQCFNLQIFYFSTVACFSTTYGTHIINKYSVDIGEIILEDPVFSKIPVRYQIDKNWEKYSEQEKRNIAFCTR